MTEKAMTDADLLGTAAPAAATPAAQQGDPAIWTVLGEAGGHTEGQRAVASTIVNRMRHAGAANPADVIADPANGYEAWQNPANRAAVQKQYPVVSPAYVAAAQNVGPILNGQVDAPYAYDSFYSPQAQKSLGRQPPKFEDGSGVDIGGNRFFAGAATPPILSAADHDLWAKLSSPGSDKGVYDPTTGQAYNDAQAKTLRALQASGRIQTPENAPPTLDGKPLLVSRDGAAPSSPGTFYVDPNGGLQQVPENPHYNGAVNFANGGLLGHGNQLLAAVQATKAAGGDLVNGGAVSSDQFGRYYRQALDTYDQAHHDYASAHPVASALTQVGGTATTLVPGMLAGGAAIGPTVARLGPVGEFIAGNAGGAGVGGRLVQGASLATNGALQGAVASAAASGENPEPFSQQVTGGAVAGGILGPALPAVAGVGSKFVRGANALLEPLSDAGRATIANRLLVARAEGSNVATPDLTEYIPGSRPTTAEAYGNTGLATAQRGVNAANSVPFTELGRANAEAREAVVQGLKGDPARRQALDGARDAATQPLLTAAFSNTQPTDPTPVVGAIDSILAGKAGQRDAVRGPLEEIRSKLVSSDGTMQTDPEQLWGIRQHIDDILSPLARGTAKDARAASRELLSVKGALDPVIEAGDPGFSNYVSKYAEMSKPINEHDFLQGLNLTTTTGKITEGQVGSALKKIQALQAAPGVNDAKALSPETMKILENLQADLARQSNSQLGRGSGSDTVQKAIEAATTGALKMHPLLRIGAYTTHPAAAAVSDLAHGFYSGQRQKILDLYVNRLLDPSVGGPALEAGQAQAGPNFLTQLGNITRPAQIPALVTANQNRLLSAGSPDRK